MSWDQNMTGNYFPQRLQNDVIKRVPSEVPAYFFNSKV